ncbi:MAG: hypothetical protein Q7T59_01010, partial [Candidatus Woesebacteria bacterium]|nr:hypothetical protein [Candidatus Woesebacteria bacterium]
QAYAAVKGFLESSEGPWFRTPKTGKITDIFSRNKFYRFIQGIIPGKQNSPALEESYLVLSTANNRFDKFNIKKAKNKRWIGKTFLVVLLSISITIYSMSDSLVKMSYAAMDNLGDGSDGAITVSSNTNCQTTDISIDDGDSTADCMATYVSSTSSSGGATLNVSSTTGFYANDEILIISILGTSPTAGIYEFKTIQSIGAGSFTLTTNLSNTYTYSSDVAETMVVRVPQYTSVTVDTGITLNVSAYSTTNNTGGILAFRATGTVTVTGYINLNGLGFPGGAQKTGGSGGTSGGTGGTATSGDNGLGGGKGLAGGAGGNPGSGSGTKGGGGAGGTDGGGGGGCYYSGCTAGGSGTSGTGGNSGGGTSGGTGSAGSLGSAGSSYGSADLSSMFFGSGGASGASGAGGGGGDTTGGAGGNGGAGGGGGGIIYISANSISVSGSVSVTGSNGSLGESGNGGNSSIGPNVPGGGGAPGAGGGGGAGGSIFLRATSLTMGSSLIISTAGSGASGGASGGVGGEFDPDSFVVGDEYSGGNSSAGAGGGAAVSKKVGGNASGGGAGSGGNGSAGRIHIEYDTGYTGESDPISDKSQIPENVILLLPLILLFPKILDWFKKKRKKPKDLKPKDFVYIFKNICTINKKYDYFWRGPPS